MTVHHRRVPGCVPVADIGLDEFELGLLAVARHFFATFAAPDTQSWLFAFRYAADRWGISEGAKAVHAMLDVAEAMRRARPSLFHFSDPHCPTCSEALTPNERHLMCMIHAIRRGRIGEAQTEAMLLTEGSDTADLMRASWVLAGLFPAAKAAARAPGHVGVTTPDQRLH